MLLNTFKTRCMWLKATSIWFLEIALVCASVCGCVSVCLSVCLPQRALITNGVIWCDIGRVQLVKQVSRLFLTFNYFIWHLLSIKWMGMPILSQHVVNACQRKLRWHGISYKRTTRKMECFIYKSEWANKAMLLKASLQLHSNNFGLKRLSTTIKTLHYYGTGV